MKLKQLINNFLKYLEFEKNVSGKTLENYWFWLNRFLSFSWNIDPIKINNFLLLDYRKYLSKKQIKIKTINYHMVCLRSFVKFLIKNDIKTISPEKIEISKTHPRMIDFLNEEEIEKLLNAPNIFEKNEQKKNRDKLILLILYWSGLRVSELINLKIEDLEKLNNWNQISIVWKWLKLRSIFISERAIKQLNEYKKFLKNNKWYLFKSLSNNSKNWKLTRVTIEKIVREYSKLVWIEKKVTPHTLRHSFATTLLIKWADIRSVQTLLWHSSITTTQIYTHVADKHLQEIHKLIN